MDCHAVTVIAQFNKPLFLSGPVDSMAIIFACAEDVTAVLVVVRILQAAASLLGACPSQYQPE